VICWKNVVSEYDFRPNLQLCRSRAHQEGSQAFAEEVSNIPDLYIDHAVLNAGILKYPNVSKCPRTSPESSEVDR
jgi:hypothetical protein